MSDAVRGEISSVTTDSIEISGIFNPGLCIEFRPGRRVFVLTEDEVLALGTDYEEL